MATGSGDDRGNQPAGPGAGTVAIVGCSPRTRGSGVSWLGRSPFGLGSPGSGRSAGACRSRQATTCGDTTSGPACLASGRLVQFCLRAGGGSHRLVPKGPVGRTPPRRGQTWSARPSKTRTPCRACLRTHSWPRPWQLLRRRSWGSRAPRRPSGTCNSYIRLRPVASVNLVIGANQSAQAGQSTAAPVLWSAHGASGGTVTIGALPRAMWLKAFGSRSSGKRRASPGSVEAPARPPGAGAPPLSWAG